MNRRYAEEMAYLRQPLAILELARDQAQHQLDHLTEARDAIAKRYNELERGVDKHVIELWSEGYACTGQNGTAQCLGEYSATSMADAVAQYNTEHPELKIEQRDGVYRVWGCRVFTDRHGAQKSFG